MFTTERNRETMSTTAEKFIFFPGDAKRASRKGITTLRDGRQVTDPDFLIHTPEFKEHLEDVRETVKDHLDSKKASSGKDN